MKKLLLTFVAAALAATSFAQSLSIVATDHEGTFETPAVDNTLNGSFQLSNGPINLFQYYFYLKNNSSQGGTVQVDSLLAINDFARAHTPVPSLCYNSSCYSGFFPTFEIDANGEYRGGMAGYPPQPITTGSGMDMQLIYSGTAEEGTGEYKLQLQFEHDDAPSVFFININFTMGNGVASAEVLGNLRVYQDAAGNVVADYGFGNDGDRTLSIVSLSGQKVYECPVDGANGTMTLPVDLGRGVYLYSVTEGGQLLSSHKFVVR